MSFNNIKKAMHAMSRADREDLIECFGLPRNATKKTIQREALRNEELAEYLVEVAHV